MKVSGTANLQGPVEHVYRLLNDPAVLVRTIPGCERLEQVGPDAYRMTVTAGVAAIRGTFSGDIRLTDQREPHSFVLRASGSGAPGTVLADVAVSLAANGDGTTQLSYDADAVVGGMVGGVGQRVLTGVARKTADEFFAAVNAVLTGTAESLTSAAEPLAGATPPAGSTTQRPAGAPQPLTEPVTAAPAHTAVTAGPGPSSPIAPAGVPAAPTVFTRPAEVATASRAGDLWALVAAASLGAFATLSGIAVGWALARRPR